MISLENSKKIRNVAGVLDTSRKMQEILKNLEKATEEAFDSFRKAKFKAWAQGQHVVMD